MTTVKEAKIVVTEMKQMEIVLSRMKAAFRCPLRTIDRLGAAFKTVDILIHR